MKSKIEWTANERVLVNSKKKLFKILGKQKAANTTLCRHSRHITRSRMNAKKRRKKNENENIHRKYVLPNALKIKFKEFWRFRLCSRTNGGGSGGSSGSSGDHTRFQFRSCSLATAAGVFSVFFFSSFSFLSFNFIVNKPLRRSKMLENSTKMKMALWVCWVCECWVNIRNSHAITKWNAINYGFGSREKCVAVFVHSGSFVPAIGWFLLLLLH